MKLVSWPLAAPNKIPEPVGELVSEEIKYLLFNPTDRHNFLLFDQLRLGERINLTALTTKDVRVRAAGAVPGRLLHAGHARRRLRLRRHAGTKFNSKIALF